MAVLQLDPDVTRHVDLFRDIRLRALQTDPSAFGSDHAREVAFDNTLWRSRLAGFGGHPGVVFASDAAADGAQPDEPVGPLCAIAGVGLPDPDDAMIWGMWVAPEARRRGLARRLLGAAEGWATRSGAVTATLWVHRANDDAQALYAERGYALVNPEDLPAETPQECDDELCMRLRLALS